MSLTLPTSLRSFFGAPRTVPASLSSTPSATLRPLRLPRAWIDEQRRPAAPPLVEKLARDPTPKQRLILRTTMGWTRAEQARIDELGYNGYLERQLDYESIDDSPLEDAIREAMPSTGMSYFEILEAYSQDLPAPFFELMGATFLRSIYSPRQLFERMVVFWSDHFSIDILSGTSFLRKPVDDREVVRRHAMGKFPDLLRASAHSPAMLLYLTNDSNVKGHPNENYARELMELHTMGADRGYTQDDVREVSRALTGWTWNMRASGRRYGEFLFKVRDHDRGPKTVLGHSIPAAGGIDDGETVLDILAEHPNTAEFVSRKMMRYLWGYEPPEGMVRRVARTYLNTGGDIREMLRVILKRPWMARATPKLKRPYHHVISAIRALEADLPDPSRLIGPLYTAGHLPFTWQPPNGFPDSEGFWSEFLLPRWNFAAEFLDERVTLANPELEASNLTPAALPDELNRLLMGGRMSPTTLSAIGDYLSAVDFDDKSVREAIGLAVASPDFQYY